MAKQSKAKKKPREDLSGVDFEFAHGATLSINVGDYSKETVKHLVLHGISQKVGDSYSGAESSEDAFALASATHKRLVDGEWAIAREGGGRGVTALIEALGRAFPDKSEEQCRKVVTDMTEEARKDLANHKRIKAHLEAIKAEKAAKKAADAMAAAEAPEEEGEEAAALPSFE